MVAMSAGLVSSVSKVPGVRLFFYRDSRVFTDLEDPLTVYKPLEALNPYWAGVCRTIGSRLWVRW